MAIVAATFPPETRIRRDGPEDERFAEYVVLGRFPGARRWDRLCTFGTRAEAEAYLKSWKEKP